MPGLLARSIITSGIASAATASALMLLGRYQRSGALMPLNASSHWLYGDRDARRRRLDITHTGVGIATHHLAVMFWAVLMEAALGRWKKRTLPELALGGALTAACAAAFDYLVVPRRLSPGWELALTRKAMTGAFAAMAVGLAAGAAAARRAK